MNWWGLLAIVAFSVAIAVWFIHVHRMETRLECARTTWEEAPVITRMHVPVRYKMPLSGVFKPIRARTELVIRQGVVQVIPDPMRRGRLYRSEFLVETQGATMRRGLASIILWRVNCTILSGTQLGGRIDLAIVGGDSLAEIESALLRSGVLQSNGHPD